MAVKITFVPGPAKGEAAPPSPAPGATVEVAEGTTLFDAGALAHAGIDTACVGKGTCGLCRVKILSGAEALSPYSDDELRHLGNLYHLTRVRLACRTRVREGEIRVEVLRKKRGK